MKMRQMRNVLSVLVMMLVVTACSQPVPMDKMNYVGEWQSEDMYLLIMEDGRVDYERVRPQGSSSMSGPIKEFDGDDFVVGLLFFSSRFEVSQTPSFDQGHWTMVVDGVELTKTR